MLFPILRALLVSTLVAMPSAAEIPADTPVVSMLQIIPQCAMKCVMNNVFQEGGCPLSTAGQLAQCACTNITTQSHLSSCVQKSCVFPDQVNLTSFASSLCTMYPKETRSNELKTISIITIALSVPLLFLRLYSRWLQNGRLWSDDAFAILAAIFLTAVSSVILQMSLLGFGLHYWDVEAENGVPLLKMFYVCQMLYVLVQVFSKVAILVLYSRLFPSFVRWFQWSVRIMIAFMLVHGGVFFLLVTFQCLPISSIWDKTISGRCLPVAAVIGFTGAGLSIVEDFIILLLPIRELWKLQMSTKKKTGLVLLLSMGSFASITSIIRLRYVLKYANTYDATWDNVDVIKWSLIEILSACICGNLMPLRPLIDRMMPSIHSVFSSRSLGSRRLVEKESQPLQKSWRTPFRKVAARPKLISTLNFTQVNLNPDRDQGRTQYSEVCKNGDVKASSTLVAPDPVYFENAESQHMSHVGKRYRQLSSESPQRAIKTTSATTPSSSQYPIKNEILNTTSFSTCDSERWSSRGSENDLISPLRIRD